MNHETLIYTKDIKFNSDTEYRAAQTVIDVALSDAQNLYDPLYYSFCGYGEHHIPTAFVLRDLNNVILDFGGAVLRLNGMILPFLIENCDNITVRNVTVEYTRSPYTEFRVLRRGGDRLYLKPLEKFPVRVENGYLIPYGETWEARRLHTDNMFIQAFDRETGEGRGLAVCVIGETIEESETPPAFVHHYRVSEEDGAVVLHGSFPGEWDSSMHIVLAHAPRDIASAYLITSKNITLQNYRILNGQGMGILGMYSENITLDGLKLTRDAMSHGIVTNGADAVHLVASKGDITLRNCCIEGMTDDALNVHTVFLEVTQVNGNQVTLLCHPERHMIRANYKVLGEGDTVQFFCGRTMEERMKTTVCETRVLDADHLEITVEHAKGIAVGDYVENLSTQPALTIGDSRFAKANSHLRIQTRGAVRIHDCEIGLPLMLTGDMNYWQEASPVRDMEIKRCRFIGDRGFVRICPEFVPTENAPYYHGNVRIHDCMFDRHVILEANAAAGLQIFGNQASDPGTELTFHAAACSDIRTDMKAE